MTCPVSSVVFQVPPFDVPAAFPVALSASDPSPLRAASSSLQPSAAPSASPSPSFDCVCK